jgi:hypothetical protein
MPVATGKVVSFFQMDFGRITTRNTYPLNMLILKYSIYLGNELNSSSNLLDLLLSKLANKLGSDDQWLLWELSLSEDLEVSVVR